MAALSLNRPRTSGISVGRILSRNPWLLSLILLIVLVFINWQLQPNLFDTRPLNGNLRVFMPAIFLAIGQTFVIIAGGVDLSVGAVLSMCNAILATQIPQDATTEQFLGAVALALIASLGAGVLNGFGVTVLRLQPIVTTYATSFIYAGIALYVLPQPGGRLPREITDFYRSPIGDAIPVPGVLIVILIVLWLFVSRTRFRQYLFATGGKDDAAFTTGVPVGRVRFTTYVISALFACFAAMALTFGNGTGNPRAGDMLTLPSIVAVVLGGTRLSGGQGSVIGSIIGVIILGTMSNIISFANLDSWIQPLVNALIIIIALAVPGLIGLLRRLRQ
jgi:ribose transport system permease protein